MITNTKQNWSVGNVVSVGFLKLTVVAAIFTPYDCLPDAYILTAKTQLYKFVPHNGLEKIDTEQALWLVQESKRAADRMASTALERIQDQARIASFISRHSEVRV